jgi:hypothetical protein
MIERTRQLCVGLFEGRLQRLNRSLALLCRRVPNGFKLARDGDRCAPRCRGERSADLLRASLRPGKAVLDIGREAPERRFKGFTAARDIADQRLETVAASFKSKIERLLLLREILPDDPKSFGMLAELPGKCARVGLGRGRKASESGDLRADVAKRVLEFLDPCREPALNGRESISSRPDRAVDEGARLTEVVDRRRQFAAQPVAGARERLDRGLGAQGYGVAQ